MRKTAVLLVAVCVALFGAGCEATLDGTCDDATRAIAFRVACDPNNAPAYTGQALINGTCAGGYCHSATAANVDAFDGKRPDHRFGVPRGFDFDLEAPSTSAELERMRQHQAFVFTERARLFERVESEAMPPSAIPATERYLGFDPVNEPLGTFADTGEALPTVRTAEGLAILRAWLVCGAPVVERDTDQTAVGGVPVGDAVSPLLCAPPEPTFASLFDKIIRGSCATGFCHGGTPATGMMVFDAEDINTTYDSLVDDAAVPASGVLAMGTLCSDGSRRRVIPGNPDDSLLIQKLEGTAPCGDRMPADGPPYLSVVTIAAFRDWITAGALR